ncbi:hypothetical protein ABID99_005695 [Mucilaginibacter sp. OAE612]|jgi:hypothetical protein|uniref:hypothetical protein n=1 Tax=Mucilaginibacter sp. OAE612 TaxID=3156444 RepID=UPI00359EA6B3
MKTSKPLFAIIFVATAAISCSKDAKTPPAQEVTPLVKQMVNNPASAIDHTITDIAYQ